MLVGPLGTQAMEQTVGGAKPPGLLAGLTPPPVCGHIFDHGAAGRSRRPVMGPTWTEFIGFYFPPSRCSYHLSLSFPPLYPLFTPSHGLS